MESKLFIVVVGQAVRGSVKRELKGLGAFIESEGYSDGSTSWTMVVEVEMTKAALQEALWRVTGWVKVEELSEEEASDAQS